MIRKIQIPSRVSSDFDGYNFLAKLHNELEELFMEQIVLDFSYNTWFEANLCAALRAIINKANLKLIQITIENLKSGNSRVGKKNQLN